MTGAQQEFYCSRQGLFKRNLVSVVRVVCACVVKHLLAGELAEHRGDVAGVLSHLLLNGLLYSRWDST